jgi:hypothetical protein
MHRGIIPSRFAYLNLTRMSLTIVSPLEEWNNHHKWFTFHQDNRIVYFRIIQLFALLFYVVIKKEEKQIRL